MYAGPNKAGGSIRLPTRVAGTKELKALMIHMLLKISQLTRTPKPAEYWAVEGGELACHHMLPAVLEALI